MVFHPSPSINPFIKVLLRNLTFAHVDRQLLHFPYFQLNIIVVVYELSYTTDVLMQYSTFELIRQTAQARSPINGGCADQAAARKMHRYSTRCAATCTATAVGAFRILGDP
jgi:hypothetical protein